MRPCHAVAVVGCICLVPFNALATPCAGFTDVDSTASYCEAATFIKNKGVTTGCAAGTTFCPNDLVTRAQMALFMQRLARGGPNNFLADATASIGGGDGNAVYNASSYSTIGGGHDNEAFGADNTIGGGKSNWTTGNQAVVAGGTDNRATLHFASVMGGSGNHADGYASSVLGGVSNIASASASVAAGSNARADQALCVVFALWVGEKPMNCLGWSSIFRVGAAHGFSVDYSAQRDDGGGQRWVGIGDVFPNQTISTWTGAYLSDGGAWTNASDRNAKIDIAEVDTQAVLDKVATMPVSTWRYRSLVGELHIGPMAQDFRAAFGLGADDRHIATVDADGVALAAIKGLNQKLDAEQRRNDALELSLIHI